MASLFLEYAKENFAPEVYEQLKRDEEKQCSKKPYTLTLEEREAIKEIMGMNDGWIDTMEIYIMNDGEICVTTPDDWWKNLCGREWWVNLKEKTSKLVALN